MWHGQTLQKRLQLNFGVYPYIKNILTPINIHLLNGVGLWNFCFITDHCFDGNKTEDETGVDCGGSCRPCSGLF